jgi:hypothetical protein
MLLKSINMLFFLVILTSCHYESPSIIGEFKVESDLFLAQFDCKTDVDDIHSVAGIATILADPRFSNVHYHAVAGAYGTQEGLYVPANNLFNASFGKNWSDAHSNYEKALKEVTLIAINTLKDGGRIWIAEAGQSDFSADLIKNIKSTLPHIKTANRIHVVQHSDWNESSTSEVDLAFVKANASYHKIPDGNEIGNGSPGFKTDTAADWKDFNIQPELLNIWEMAFEIANRYNGKDGRYLNASIASGGMDFSDVSETCWIFGFNHLLNAEQFFNEFLH